MLCLVIWYQNKHDNFEQKITLYNFKNSIWNIWLENEIIKTNLIFFEEKILYHFHGYNHTKASVNILQNHRKIFQVFKKICKYRTGSQGFQGRFLCKTIFIIYYNYVVTNWNLFHRPSKRGKLSPNWKKGNFEINLTKV